MFSVAANRIGAPDPSLTAVSGMAAVSELREQLGVIEALDSAVGAIKQRDRGQRRPPTHHLHDQHNLTNLNCDLDSTSGGLRLRI